MQIQELNKREFELLLEEGTQRTLLFFFYTPLCGTCRLAEKMLSITLEAIESEIDTYRVNINYIPDTAESWEIQSVPCLCIFSKGEAVGRIYAFHSVDYLYRQLSSIA